MSVYAWVRWYPVYRDCYGIWKFCSYFEFLTFHNFTAQQMPKLSCMPNISLFCHFVHVLLVVELAELYNHSTNWGEPEQAGCAVMIYIIVRPSFRIFYTSLFQRHLKFSFPHVRAHYSTGCTVCFRASSLLPCVFVRLVSSVQ